MRAGGATAKPAEAPKVTKPPAVVEQLAGTTAGQTEGQALVAGPIDQSQGEEQEEARQIGHVKPRVYASYARAAGTFLVSIIAISLTLMQASPSQIHSTFLYGVPGCVQTCCRCIAADLVRTEEVDDNYTLAVLYREC